MAPGGSWNVIEFVFMLLAEVYDTVNDLEPSNLDSAHSSHGLFNQVHYEKSIS